MTYAIIVKFKGVAALSLRELAEFNRRQAEFEHPTFIDTTSPSEDIKAIIFSLLYRKAHECGSILRAIDFVDSLSKGIEVEEADI